MTPPAMPASGPRCSRTWTGAPTRVPLPLPSSSRTRPAEDAMMQGLAQFGDTRQRLLRQLLLARDGAGVEELCECLRITHNAVRQHLTTLIVRGLVERVQPRATGGRPQARYVLTAEGRELFPRNYGAIAAALISQLHARMGEAEVGAMLQELGATVAATQAPLQGENGEALTRALAQRLDALGYEAVPARHGDDWQVEAFNCVFHSLARQHPQVCKFDLEIGRATV